jgi:enamine deaminase RidA (YjgF/YER057c/UK114 family)
MLRDAWANVVKRQTFTTDMDSYFRNSVDVRAEFSKDDLCASTTVEVRRLSFPDF